MSKNYEIRKLKGAAIMTVEAYQATEDEDKLTLLKYAYRAAKSALKGKREIQAEKDSGMIPMPEQFQGKFFNASSDACDFVVGPCACGAWHEIEDWLERLQE